MRSRSPLICGSLVLILACMDEPTSSSRAAAPRPRAAADVAETDSAVIIAAGDIHTYCDRPWVLTRAAATAAVAAKYPDALVIPMGDLAGEFGTAAEFQCYDASWGKLKDRTYPVMGNHELSQDQTATPYYDYFNGVGVDSGRAGKRGKAYYSVDAAGWRIYIANFNAYNQPLDEQEAWMKQDLAANPHLCTMAVWHRPLFVSSDQPSGVHKASKLPRWWNTLYAGGLDVILNGHSHLYERFGKLRSDGVVDSARGIREIIAGTGAAGLYKFNTILAGSEKRILSNGVLKMTLRPSSYSWEFLDMKAVVKDSGSDTCH